jgi:hypothetical protein
MGKRSKPATGKNTEECSGEGASTYKIALARFSIDDSKPVKAGFSAFSGSFC